MPDAVEFRALGPLVIAVDGRAVTPGSRQLRVLLATLLVDAGKVVSADRLARSLWGDDAPDDAQSRVSKLVYRLRAALPADARDVIETVSPGYLLHVSDGYDVATFESQLSDGRAQLVAGDYPKALASFDAALKLWHGPAFAEFAEDDFVRVECARLEGARMIALEDRVQALLSLGRHGEVVGELEALVVAHPFRERLWEELMIALYRSGRQADALRAYSELREHLRDELGIEPSDSLRELEGAILRQEPDLTAPIVEPSLLGPPPDEEPATAEAQPARRRFVAMGAGVVIAVAAIASIGALVIGADDDGAVVAPSKKVTMPYEAQLVETLGGNSSGSTFHGVIAGTVTGHGTYTGISHTTRIPPVCTIDQGVPTTTSTVITTDSGDTLRQDETGHLCSRSPTALEFTGTFAFSGGTGCFADASGGGRITATITGADATFTTGEAISDDVGSIVLERKSHCPQTK